VASFIKSILLIGIGLVCHTVLADEAPDWVKKPPVEDGQNRFYVGRATGKYSERELFQIAHEDAKNAAISENYGVLTQVSKQSYETLDSSTSVNRVSESSKQVILKQFQKIDQHIDNDSVWVLYKYPKQEIVTELKRLETQNNQSQSIEFSELNTTSSKNVGTLEISAIPTDVTVTIDNQSYGLAPVRLRLAEGSHSLTLDHPYFEPIQEQVIIQTEKTLRVQKTLVRAKRKVLIKTMPEQASIELGGKYLGVSPIETEVIAGQKLAILINHPKTMPYKSEIEIGKGIDTHVINVPPLTMKPSYFSINTNPQGADVFLSGKFFGKTPTGIIEGKSGTLIIKKSGFVEYEQFLALRGGEKRILPMINLESISDEEKRRIEEEKRRNNFYGGLFEIGSGPLKDKSLSVISVGGFVEKTIFQDWFGIKGSLSYRNGIGGEKYSTADSYQNNLSGFEATIAAPIYFSGLVFSPEGGVFSGTYIEKNPTVTGSIVDTTNLTSTTTSLSQSFYGGSIRYQYPSWEIYTGYRKYGSSNGLEGAGAVFLGFSFRGKW
jgi:hypothetical protein